MTDTPLDLDVIRARWNDPDELPHPNQAEADVAALIAAVRYERSEVERQRAAWRSLSDLRWQLAEERDQAEHERDEARARGAAVLALCDGVMPPSPYTLAAEIRAALALPEDTGGGTSTIDGDRLDADLAFIAHARADVPALVAEVRRLLSLLDRIAYPALMYDARVYVLSEDAPELLDRLTPELRALVGERPSEVARRVEEERDDARAAIARVRALDPAEHATSSRDYGRGYAQALRDVNAALEKTDG